MPTRDEVLDIATAIVEGQGGTLAKLWRRVRDMDLLESLPPLRAVRWEQLFVVGTYDENGKGGELCVVAGGESVPVHVLVTGATASDIWSKAVPDGSGV